MKYIIRVAILQTTPELEISSQEYTQLVNARKILSAALRIEEKYEILIANYLSFEKKLLEIAVTEMVRNSSNYSEHFSLRTSINIKLVNLLTSARLYLDQFPQDISECLPDENEMSAKSKAFCSKEYDENFEFRFMESLRNYVQHRGIPLHATTRGSRRTNFSDNYRLEYYIDIASLRSTFAEDKKFKQSVLKEMPEKIDLTVACRSYIESISAIHENVRKLIEKSTENARQCIKEFQNRYTKIYSGDLLSLTAYALRNTKVLSETPILLEWDDVRKELQNRNTQLINLRKCYATGRASTDRY